VNKGGNNEGASKEHLNLGERETKVALKKEEKGAEAEWEGEKRGMGKGRGGHTGSKSLTPLN